MIIVAVSMVALMSAMALAIDLGMLYKNRSDAQRSADAAALAGASAFLDAFGPDAVDPARNRAVEFLGHNSVGNDPIDTSDLGEEEHDRRGLLDSLPQAVVEVIPDEFKVRVEVRRADNETWFGRLFGQTVMPVRARAAARLTRPGRHAASSRSRSPTSGTTRTGTWTAISVGHARNGNKEVEGEIWRFGDDPGDYYSRFDPTVLSPVPPQTGYGSTYRTDVTKDWGREIKMKVTNPNDVSQAQSGIFFPWSLPAEDLTAECKFNPGGGDNGRGHVPGEHLQLQYEPDPVEHALLDQDRQHGRADASGRGRADRHGQERLLGPRLYRSGNRPSGRIAYKGPSDYSDNPMGSPRVIKVAMYDPDLIDQVGHAGRSSSTTSRCSSSRSRSSSRHPVKGRFLFYVAGDDSPGTTTGPLVTQAQAGGVE